MELNIRLGGIDLNLLLTLSLLLQTRSVTGTARKLGISQPAVSRALAQLRDVFQDPLLIRTNRGMELTLRGEELINPLQDWLANTTSLFRAKKFDPGTLNRRFRVASTDFGVLAVVAPALPHIHALAPQVSIEVVPFSDTMVAKLGSGDLDLIITGIEPDLSVTYGRHLFQESSICVMRADHPVLEGGITQMQLDQFLHWPHIAMQIGETAIDSINHFLGERAAERKIVAALPYFHVAPYLLTETDAIMTLPSRLAARFSRHPRLTMTQAPAEVGTFGYWILWHERSRRDAATMWIVDMLSAACGQTVE
ncbi:MAG: LysR family transcriptional regulator [Sphingobium sp.]